jgi:hypothetical protein
VATMTLSSKMGKARHWWTYQVNLVQSVAGTDTLVAAVTGKRIRLVGMIVTPTADGTLTIESKPSGTAVTLVGPMNFLSGIPTGFPLVRVQDMADVAWAETVAGSALQITTTGGGLNGSVLVAVEE